MIHTYPVTEALHFLKFNTSLDTSQAIGRADPNFEDTVFITDLRDQYGEWTNAVVYLSDDGCHDFERED